MTDDGVMTNDDGDGTDVDLTTLLEQALVLAVQAMAGQAIGKVDTYDSAADRVAITPLVPLVVAGETIPATKLPAVPVAWPQLGGMSLKFPLLPGAFMRLSVLGHDHSGWTVSGTEGVPPTNERRFSLSDLVAVPLAPSPLSTPPDPTAYDSAWAVLFGQLKVGSSAASDFVALASKVITELTSLQTWANSHTHLVAGAMTGGPGITTATGLPTKTAPGAVAASKLKAL